MAATFPDGYPKDPEQRRRLKEALSTYLDTGEGAPRRKNAERVAKRLEKFRAKTKGMRKYE